MTERIKLWPNRKIFDAARDGETIDLDVTLKIRDDYEELIRDMDENYQRLKLWSQNALQLLEEMYTTRTMNLNDIAVAIATAPIRKKG